MPSSKDSLGLSTNSRPPRCAAVVLDFWWPAPLRSRFVPLSACYFKWHWFGRFGHCKRMPQMPKWFHVRPVQSPAPSPFFWLAKPAISDAFSGLQSDSKHFDRKRREAGHRPCRRLPWCKMPNSSHPIPCHPILSTAYRLILLEYMEDHCWCPTPAVPRKGLKLRSIDIHRPKSLSVLKFESYFMGPTFLWFSIFMNLIYIYIYTYTSYLYIHLDCLVWSRSSHLVIPILARGDAVILELQRLWDGMGTAWDRVQCGGSPQILY